MKKSKFISLFIIQFLASWMANNYSDFCARGLQKELETPPVEDAMFLAEKAWNEVNKHDAV